MNRKKRDLLDFDPNASDPDDGDYDNRTERPARHHRPRRHSKSGSHRPAKRPRQRYSDSDIENDDGVVSEESWTNESEEDGPGELNPRTGRPLRQAAKTHATYEESEDDDDEEIQDTVESEEEDELKPTPRKKSNRNTRMARQASLSGTPAPSLKITLKLPPDVLSAFDTSSTHTRGHVSSNTEMSRHRRRESRDSEERKTRRSSRLSHDIEEPTYQLTTSGRHAEITQPASSSREQSVERVPIGRQSRGGKGVKGSTKHPQKMPSAIMEASQETSQQTKEEPLGNNEDEEVEAEEPQVENEIAESEAVSPTAAAENVPATQDVEMEEGNGDEAAKDDEDAAEDEDEDDGPVTHRRSLRVTSHVSIQITEFTNRLQSRAAKVTSGTATPARSSQKRKRPEESSDFELAEEDDGDEEEEDMSDSESPRKKRKTGSTSDSSSGGRRSQRLANKRSSRRRGSDSQDSGIDPDELAEEAAELSKHAARRRQSRRSLGGTEIIYDDHPKLRNRAAKPDYRLFRPELFLQLEEEENAAPEPSRSRGRKTGGPAYRSLFDLSGPFGGAGPRPLLGGPPTQAVGGVDSDSSDDEGQRRPRVPGPGGVPMTPASAHAPGFADTLGGPSALGKITKEKTLLADADPLGVDQNVNFDGVGGLDDHINHLKEMVMLPLLYPEMFQRFHVTPPRGVLFHGPPGTGKTLLARALASSVSTSGKKVTFYMRKGADALSKWVGEAERQLRLLFEEARKNQPSIIFFDEIDGLAPVRSSKQEQIHSSIVATLLALMDGMDGRGQVIVIGATNRPDAVDPALRRPGRFDREFYFALPNLEARREIINIHTKGWDPPLEPAFKDQLAELTKGYGGADLRALCTEAALNAIQGTYPQIFASDKKLLVDPAKIKVLAKDFMISINRMIPSSERSASTTSGPVKKRIEPLIRKPLEQIMQIIDDVMPQKKKRTALEEAMYDDRDNAEGFEREALQRDLAETRVYRPRLLISGLRGMGQQYLAAAVLQKLETSHMQPFDLPTLLEDAGRTPEAAVVQLFKEVKRHKPSVVFIPNVDVWWETVEYRVRKLFTQLLRSLDPNDQVLVLGIMETESEIDAQDEELKRLRSEMMRDIFGFSSKNQHQIVRPDERARSEFFEGILAYIRKSPADLPDPDKRKKRVLPALQLAPEPEAPKGPTKEDLKKQKKQDRHTLNLLKIAIQPVMDQIKLKFKKFRNSVVDDREIDYLYEDRDPNQLTSDLTEEQRQEQEMHRPFVMAVDKHGVPGIKEVATDKFYYNINIVIIEQRLSNGYYKRPSDFLGDIKRLAKDARTSGDQERTLKANELISNVEVDMQMIEYQQPQLVAECEAVYERERAREKEEAKKATAEADVAGLTSSRTIGLTSNVPPGSITTGTESTGPVVLGEPIPGSHFLPPVTPDRRQLTGHLSNGEPHTNGSTVPSRPTDAADVVMSDVGQAKQQTPAAFIPSMATHTPSGPGTQQSQMLSQTSAITKMAPGTQLTDYHNSASTTTSGQKTSDHSNRASDHSSGAQKETQNSNGTEGLYPDFSNLQNPESLGSQIPDTQDGSGSDGRQQGGAVSFDGADVYGRFSPFRNRRTNQALQKRLRSKPKLTVNTDIPSTQHSSSQSQPSGSQPNTQTQPASLFAIPPIPARVAAPTATGTPTAAATATTQHTSNVNSLLNPTEQPTYILDNALLGNFHSQLVSRSSGLSVEQLEQVYAALVGVIWATRGHWNRDSVIRACTERFNEVVRDIEGMQAVLQSSLEEQEERRGGAEREARGSAFAAGFVGPLGDYS